MPENKGKGGKRSGAGRKPKPKLPFAAKHKASNVLERLGGEYKGKKLPAEDDFWIGLLAATDVKGNVDLRLRFDVLKYLTDRRDGKPAQGVFIGDTRESTVDIDFGDILMPAAPNQPGAPGKPN